MTTVCLKCGPYSTWRLISSWPWWPSVGGFLLACLGQLLTFYSNVTPECQQQCFPTRIWWGQKPSANPCGSVPVFRGVGDIVTFVGLSAPITIYLLGLVLRVALNAAVFGYRYLSTAAKSISSIVRWSSASLTEVCSHCRLLATYSDDPTWYTPESMLDSSELSPRQFSDLPKCQIAIYVIHCGRYFRGYGIRVPGGVVIPEHVIGSAVSIEMRSPFATLDVVDVQGSKIDVTTDCLFLPMKDSVLAPLQRTTAQPSVVVPGLSTSAQLFGGPPDKLWTSYGQLSHHPKLFGFLRYCGSTLRGASGAPIVVGKRVAAMHVGSEGKFNISIAMDYILFCLDQQSKLVLQSSQKIQTPLRYNPESFASTGEYLENLARKGKKRKAWQGMDGNVYFRGRGGKIQSIDPSTLTDAMHDALDWSHTELSAPASGGWGDYMDLYSPESGGKVKCEDSEIESSETESESDHPCPRRQKPSTLKMTPTKLAECVSNEDSGNGQIARCVDASDIQRAQSVYKKNGFGEAVSSLVYQKVMKQVDMAIRESIRAHLKIQSDSTPKYEPEPEEQGKSQPPASAVEPSSAQKKPLQAGAIPEVTTSQPGPKKKKSSSKKAWKRSTPLQAQVSAPSYQGAEQSEKSSAGTVSRGIEIESNYCVDQYDSDSPSWEAVEAALFH
ncbi:hypothetical protein [Hubei myriapoda virus 9]|uniref:hypothetical protein n=1 Tax=Hubei myriapoda virus 9 TaxID=1922938 RepID=UPI00090A7567|nr:hypothetical protein [Hubei myriapoda virus 9]APG75638.1 hypothetical protein [Hubei myriapoda virus 9]APG75894.1 hypothetical protein 2 [Hubei myriapoda virus 9]APG75930.1 hypothetical protein 2 [Hubei myriapoda virus 9]APG75938.1 hypothetical protein 2 [Hubei myriapoda virus 9]APG75967.1 hypothetical protein 2 [Hubei myriapoda virus 9]